MALSLPRTGSIKNKIVADDLLEERKNLNFNQEELTHLFFGSKEFYEEFNEHIRFMEADPLLRNDQTWYELTREEQMELLMKKARRVYEINRKKYYHDYEVGYFQWFYIMFKGIFPLGLSMTMFMTCIESLADDEQRNKWLPLIKDIKIIGCYAQTELGHGSNVAGIETTATYDQQSDEFVINSPTLTSSKFWPGDMGKMANHAVLYARLISKGKDRGVQPFMVQMRDFATHEPLPGFEMGDIGPKFGYNSKDNGFQIFKNVRIPRANLLRRFAEVDREGNFTTKGDQRILYSIMLTTRVQIINYSAFSLGQALLIATRYSVVRRQFSNQEGTKVERKLLDYQTHMFKYGPLLAYTYAMKFAAIDVMKLHQDVLKGVETGDFSKLELLHHLSAGYKAVYSRITYDATDDIRQSCGGAGFLHWSGLPSHQQEYSPNPTFEGDNTVMSQQAARLILKNFKQLMKGKKVTGYFSYLNNILEQHGHKSQVQTVEDVLSLQFLDKALSTRAAYKISQTSKKLEQSKDSENAKINSIFALDVVQMTQAHVIYTTFQHFHNGINTNSNITCPTLKQHLTLLLRLFAVYELTIDNAVLYECGFFQPGTLHLLQEALKKLLVELRPQMIPLVEAAKIPDSTLVSAIGNSYGDIYETQLEWARNSRLNKTHTAPGFKEHILPIINGKL
eukprot:403352422